MGVVIINIEKYPQFELYKFTKKLNLNKEKMVPKNCDNRCVYSTIINRCYYSSYLYALEWLFEKHGFKPLSKSEWDDGKFVTEHGQVRLMFKEIEEKDIALSLFKLLNLRKKADYEPFSNISDGELNKAMGIMESIFQNLDFDNC